ncbi:hypothetical protein WBG78_05435 [Chryseolinea sp. T2]|uniref:hypothetical protein n=1 Tax=Chryseolinea sp. T2 TaxID=3129255 RepID=UPI0030770E8B
MCIKMAEVEYTYLGDKQTDPARKKVQCSAVKDLRGKCIRGKNGNFLVRFEDGTKSVVIGRLLRKVLHE